MNRKCWFSRTGPCWGWPICSMSMQGRAIALDCFTRSLTVALQWCFAAQPRTALLGAKTRRTEPSS